MSVGRREDGGREQADLVERLCIKQDPANLDDLGRVFGDVDAMLIASGLEGKKRDWVSSSGWMGVRRERTDSDVYDDKAVEIVPLRLGNSHDWRLSKAPSRRSTRSREDQRREGEEYDDIRGKRGRN